MSPNIKLLPPLLLALLSGAAALAHQILWTRRMVDAVGANTDTFSKVIGSFFVGLALGAWFASRSGNGGRPPWHRVALAELVVALLALPPLFSAQFAELAARNHALTPGLKFLLPLLLITPPAMAMGLVTPWMVRALAVHQEFRSHHAVWLYAMNTVGGILGIAFVLLEALPRFGLTGASLCAVGVNLAVALGALGMSRNTALPNLGPPNGGPLLTGRRLPSEASPAESTIPAALLAFASGFLVLALEVVLQHQFAQITINSLFSSATVLALVLTSLAAAAFLTPALVRRTRSTRRALWLALAAAAVLSATQPFLLTGMRSGVNILPYEFSALPYTWEVIKIGLVAVCPMLLAAGCIFPLLLRSAVETRAGDMNRQVGQLLAWNGLGGWLGAELSQTWLAPAFGLWGSMVMLAAGYGGLSAILHFVFPNSTPAGAPIANRESKILTPAALAMGIGVCAWFARGLPQATVLPGERLAEVRVGREGVVATVECGPDDWRILFNNSYTLGGSKAQFNQERQGLLPLILHGNPKSVGVLGVATGGTTAGVALHPGVEQVDAMELSPLALRFADQFFTPFNRNIFRDPRLRFIQEDARWVVARHLHAYDVVVGDLFLPWRTGEGRLFTREHFQNVRRSLKPGGLYCQWLPLFQLTRSQFDTIVRTWGTVFPASFLVRGDFYSDLPIVGLVGGRDFSMIDWAQIEAGCAKIRLDGKTLDPLVRHAEGVAMLLLGPPPVPPPGPVNTLANAWLEWDAGRNILGMNTPWFIGIPSAEYVRDVQRAGNMFLPENLRVAHEAGQFFLTLEVAAKLNLPALEDLRLQVPKRIPDALRQDGTADWRQWPMRVKPDFHSRAGAKETTAPP